MLAVRPFVVPRLPPKPKRRPSRIMSAGYSLTCVGQLTLIQRLQLRPESSSRCTVMVTRYYSPGPGADHPPRMIRPCKPWAGNSVITAGTRFANPANQAACTPPLGTAMTGLMESWVYLPIPLKLVPNSLNPVHILKNRYYPNKSPPCYLP